MKIPGPDHPITITPSPTRWRGRFHDHILADGADVLVLQEASYPPVAYFRREDVATDYLGRTAHSTHCPYKGDASYFTVSRDGEVIENAVWSYEQPFPAMQAITGRLAFYPQHFDIYAVDDAAVNPKHVDVDVDQAVLHTDSGSGAPQREPWPANVTGPNGAEGGVR